MLFATKNCSILIYDHIEGGPPLIGDIEMKRITMLFKLGGCNVN